MGFFVDLELKQLLTLFVFDPFACFGGKLTGGVRRFLDMECMGTRTRNNGRCGMWPGSMKGYLVIPGLPNRAV